MTSEAVCWSGGCFPTSGVVLCVRPEKTGTEKGRNIKKFRGINIKGQRKAPSAKS